MERDIEETEELVVREPNGWKILKKRPPWIVEYQRNNSIPSQIKMVSTGRKREGGGGERRDRISNPVSWKYMRRRFIIVYIDRLNVNLHIYIYITCIIKAWLCILLLEANYSLVIYRCSKSNLLFERFTLVCTTIAKWLFPRIYFHTKHNSTYTIFRNSDSGRRISQPSVLSRIHGDFNFKLVCLTNG